MLNDLDASLEELLRNALPSTWVASDARIPVAISFATPDQDFTKHVNLPAINLFLYDVRENMELRNNQQTFERTLDGNAIYHRSPVHIDCSYLITAWAKEPADAETEHRLLGEVIKVLWQHPRLPTAVLQGSLRAQQPLPRALLLRPAQLQSMGEFWQAMGGRPKPAMNYTVTISISSLQDEQPAPLVMERWI